MSGIEWTDETWNPVRGCTKVSPGCAHSYAHVAPDGSNQPDGDPVDAGDPVAEVRE